MNKNNENVFYNNPSFEECILSKMFCVLSTTTHTSQFPCFLYLNLLKTPKNSVRKSK